MLLWAVDRPEREALAVPEPVRVESIPVEPLRNPDLGQDPLWSAPNLLLTPHLAGDTPRRFRRSWRFAGEQVTRLHAGLPLENVILAR